RGGGLGPGMRRPPSPARQGAWAVAAARPGAAPHRLVGQSGPTRPAGVVEDAELVEESSEVLLDRRLRHNQRISDVTDGGWLMEQISRQQGTAELDQHVALPGSQFRR